MMDGLCFLAAPGRPPAATAVMNQVGASEVGNRFMRILVVDDHEIVRRGVISLLLARPDCLVCGEAANGQEAVERAQSLHPDVIIMDVSMPGLNGIEATRIIHNVVPGSEVLVLSQHDAPEMARQAFKAGARGYVIKSSVGKNLTAALDKVSHHQCYFDPAISEIANPFDIQEILQRSAALEQALGESERLYRSTFELAAVGLAHVSREGRWLLVNHRLCEILGYPEEELLETTFQELTHPDDLSAYLSQSAKIVSGEIPTFSMEKRFIRKDKSQVWVNLTVSAARDAAGNFKHFISLIEDIAERRQADETRARLAAIVASSDDAIISKDLNGIIASWNAAATRVFEFTPEETIGRSITILIPPELQEEETQILKRLRRGERIDHFETIRITKSGKRVNVSLSISPVRDGKGRIIGAAKIARDITDRKRAEQALRKSDERLRAAFSQTYSFLVILTLDGTVIDANQPALEAAGCTREELLGRKMWEQWWSHLPDEIEKLKTAIAQAASGQVVREECYFCLPDGTRRFADRTISPVKDEAGRIIMLVASGLDTTEQKDLRDELEERVKKRTHQLQKKNQELIEQARTVRELSGKLLQAQDQERRRLARELHDSAGQLIAAVQMNLMPFEAQGAKFGANFERAIGESLDFLRQLSEELRTVSHLLHPPLLDEAGLPSALRWYVEGFAERSKIDVQLDLSPHLARMSSDLEVTLFRVVQECLTNIHRHSGSKRATIHVFGAPNEVCLEVRDYGKGMPSLKENGASHLRSGVGIQGMRERLRQLNGHLEIVSFPDGTQVSARLPLTSTAVPIA
jgi:PAS domain S-box-containing protein